MTVKINMIQKSFIFSLLLIAVLAVSVIPAISLGWIVPAVAGGLLVVLTSLQLYQFIEMKKLLAKTGDILSKGNERDFSILEDKEKNIINYKITNLIEQLEDSVLQAEQTLREKEELEEANRALQEKLEGIKSFLNKEVMELKNKIVGFDAVLGKSLSDINELKEYCGEEENLISELLDIFDTYRSNYSAIQNSVETTRQISDREITRSEQILVSLTSLYDQTEDSEEQLVSIIKGIDNIREVTDIINEVADKASILSLNAAIESAHAGEAGKGFAVVAEEVGVLASSTAEHAENINNALYSVSDLITESKQNDSKDTDAYPLLISDVKEIANALKAIRETLTYFSNLKNPDKVNTMHKRSAMASLLDDRLTDLAKIKKDLAETVDTIGNLTQLENIKTPEKVHSESVLLHETSVKPIEDEAPIDI